MTESPVCLGIFRAACAEQISPQTRRGYTGHCSPGKLTWFTVIFIRLFRSSCEHAGIAYFNKKINVLYEKILVMNYELFEQFILVF